MSYLYKINIVVDEDEEDIQVQNTIDETVRKALMKMPFVEVIGEQIVELDKSVCGKCSCCGAWTSDKDSTRSIDEFSDGCLIEGKWWCDICLPRSHPKSFWGS